MRKFFLISLLFFGLAVGLAAADESSYATQYLYQVPKLNYQTDLKVVAEIGSPMLAAGGNAKAEFGRVRHPQFADTLRNPFFHATFL
jgi:hypothetical protein